jgi:hypothetical protein
MTTLIRQRRKHKRRVDAPADPHGFESIGAIMRRLRGEVECQMTDEFSHALSLRLDALLDEEQRLDEGRET